MDRLRVFLLKPTTLLGLLIITGLLLALGMVLPIMTIKTLVFMRHSFSVVSGIIDLFKGGKFALFFIVLVFSIIFPVLKLTFLTAIVVGWRKHKPSTQRYLALLHDYGRWAMLDVFVVAVLVVALKLGSIANVKIHYGLYVFSIAVLLTMWITHLVVVAERQN